MIILKTERDLEAMRPACAVASAVLAEIIAFIQPGVTTREVDEFAAAVIKRHGARSAFLGYRNYPCHTCISVNDEVVHGIPGGRRVAEGDIVSVDFGVRIDGWCGDAATTILVGQVGAEERKLCEATEHVLRIAIENIRPGRKWSQVAQRMQGYAERQGLSVIKDFVGHGIGRMLHEEPKIPNFVSPELLRSDIELVPGLVLAVEPMCALGSDRVKMLSDGWTVVTADGRAAAHYEHMIAVTESGCSVLTDGN